MIFGDGVELSEECNITFPSFDLAFAHYFAYTRKGYNIQTMHPELFKKPNDILQDLANTIQRVSGASVSDFIKDIPGDIAEEIVGKIPGAGLLYKYLTRLTAYTQKWWQRRGNEQVKQLENMDQSKLLTALPTFLAADLYDWLFDDKSNQKRRLVILFDTYEALWRDQPTKIGVESIRVDSWVRLLVEETPGVLYLIHGRDKLNWADIESEWEADIEDHLIEGLSQKDANHFLQQVPIENEEIRTAIINSADGLPFYLDLQVDLYESLKQESEHPSVNEFGGENNQILARFIDHLDEPSRRDLQIISHARFVDEKLAQKLVIVFPDGKSSINFEKF